MTWSLTASGSAASADDEQLLIGDARQALTSEQAGTTAAALSTSFHGVVDLLAPDPNDPGADDVFDQDPSASA